jgi:GntR family transcriptional regulator/MocR family aminotransferase
VLIRLDGRGPLYQQLYRAVRAAILGGRLKPETRLPSSRDLARDLALSRNTVVLAYEQLAAEGYVRGKGGSGTYVSAQLPDDMTSARTKSVPEWRASELGRPALSAYAERLVSFAADRRLTWEPRPATLPYDFRYGSPAFDPASHEIWCRLLAQQARRSSVRQLDYGPPQGLLMLRQAIAGYLQRARAVACTPDQVLVVNGSQQALDLAARLMIDPGDAIAIEEPHYPGARTVFEAAGARLLPLGVDGDGLRTADLAAIAEPVKLAYVTPAHQFPTGAILPVGRRLELLAWAERANVSLFEDDYDSEYRFDSRPVEALQGMDRGGRVLYSGTFSKLLFPALRLGYLVLPEALVAPFVAAKGAADTGSATLPQLTLAHFIEQGHFERHLRRSRTRHAARRAAMLEAIRRHLGGKVEVSGANAGLHVLLWLKGVRPAQLTTLRRRAEGAGVGVYPASRFFMKEPGRAGLILGYAALSEAEIRTGIRLLAGALDGIREADRASSTIGSGGRARR